MYLQICSFSGGAERRVRRGPDQDVRLLRLPGHSGHQDLQGLLRQRHEGMSCLPLRARRKLGQICR